MPICKKCNTVNEEGLTHCRSCNAFLPVQLGSKAAHRWERVRRQPDLVGMKCPNCGTINPYTRFRCQSCNAQLAGKRQSSGVPKILLYVGIAMLLLATLLGFVLRAT